MGVRGAIAGCGGRAVGASWRPAIKAIRAVSPTRIKTAPPRMADIQTEEANSRKMYQWLDAPRSVSISSSVIECDQPPQKVPQSLEARISFEFK